MGSNRIRFGLPLRWTRGLRRGVGLLGLTLVIGFLLVVLHLRDTPIAPPSLQVVTHLQLDHCCPVDEGDPVCLTGVVEAIGKVGSIRALRGARAGRWEVVLLLDKRYQPQIPADSVTLLRMPGDDRGYCEFSGAHRDARVDRRLRFLEIDTTIHGRCFDTPHCNLSAAPIADRAVLKISNRLWCGAEGVLCGGVGEMIRQPWWSRAIEPVIGFLAMDIGVIYIELFGAVVTVLAGAIILIIFVRRRIRSRANRATPAR